MSDRYNHWFPKLLAKFHGTKNYAITISKNTCLYSCVFAADATSKTVTATATIRQLTPEEIAASAAAAALRLREEAKQARQTAVDAITVEVNGKVFDGDETSQTRMSRAILGMQATGQATITLVLADNTVTQATLAELTEALCLAGARQAELWVLP